MSPRRITPLLLLGLVFCGTLSEDELLCEEAAERIRTCCGFRPLGLDCEDPPEPVLTCAADSPALEAERSRCLAAQPCDLLEGSGYCAWARGTYYEGPPPPYGSEPALCR